MTINKRIKWLLICHMISNTGNLAFAQDPLPMLKEVVISAPLPASPLLAQPSALGYVNEINIADMPAPVTRLDQILVNEGLATSEASSSLGLATGLAVRGFVIGNQGNSQLQAGRIFLNGHSDIAWRFSRDPATLERIELIGGHDATLLGAGSPAASIHYISKSPKGKEFQTLSLTTGSNSTVRATLDKEIHADSLKLRGVMVLHRNDKTVEGVQDERSIALISAILPVGAGALRYDTEHNQLRMPYPFGTVYADGKFWFDKSYVDDRASANRLYHRHALYWEQLLADQIDLALHLQHLRSNRNETLLGFFDPVSSTQMRGYYRTIDEHNAQSDRGLKLSGRFSIANFVHNWAAVAQQHEQQREFFGPQNIGGFMLDLQNPVFPTNLSGLVLSQRYSNENYRERGIGVANTARAGDWDFRVGIRRASFEILSSTKLGVAQARVAGVPHTTVSTGMGFQVHKTQRLWLTRTESFLPNRGRFSNGDFLPPSEGLQWELGWEFRSKTDALAVAVFDMYQSNLPGKDASAPDAFVLLGRNRSTGIELRAIAQAVGMEWHASMTQLHARISNPISVSQGTYLTGIARAYGALQVSKKFNPQWQGTASLQANSRMPGDDKASFFAPGSSVLNVSIKSQDNRGMQWGIGIDNLLDRRYVRALTGADNVWQGPLRKFSVWVEFSGL